MADIEMDEAHRKVLQGCIMSFKRNMSSLSDVIGYLEQDEILNETMREQIYAKTTPSEQIAHLHRLIPRRSQKAFDSYYHALRKTSNDHLASQLEPHLYHPSVRMSRGDDITDDIPGVWPDFNADPLDVKVKKCDPSNEDMKEKFRNDHDVYCMKMKSARVLIINNKEFEKSQDTNETLGPREGTDVDATCLDTLFKELGFKNVKTLKELKKQGILDALKVEKDKPSCEGFICFILSHGKEESVYGTDGEYVSLENIINQFDGENCPALIGKPKLFFIQACQGKKKDVGATAATDSCTQTASDADVNNLTEQLESVTLPTEQTDEPGKVPIKADIFVAIATTPGFVSWRNEKYGSWFIQAFVHIIKNLAHKQDLQAILTRVNRMVSEQRTTSSGFVQVPQKKDTLTKEFYFFPGFGPNDSAK